MSVYLSIRDFGAVGDGVADDTAAIQKAIDEGARTGRTVYIDPGRYSLGELFLRPSSSLKAEAQWGFRYDNIGNAVLVQRFENQRSVLNISQANGATLDGLSITGERKPGGCHGILCDKPDFGKMEDAFRIERCRSAAFSGHAVYLHRVWCYTARHNMFCFSGGDGLRQHGWDAFVSDNWFSGNKGAGFSGEDANCSVTLTGNRIEWNQAGGIVIEGGSHYNITGNYIDRSGCAGIRIAATKYHNERTGIYEGHTSNTITCTGNVIYRSGKFAKTPDDSCHLFLKGCAGVTVVGNSLCIGRDDRGQGAYSPETAMILQNLTECVVSGNTMFVGALKQLVDDRGGHENTVIRDNVGSLFPQEALASTDAGLPTDLVIGYRSDLQRQFAED